MTYRFVEDFVVLVVLQQSCCLLRVSRCFYQLLCATMVNLPFIDKAIVQKQTEHLSIVHPLNNRSLKQSLQSIYVYKSFVLQNYLCKLLPA